MAAEPVRFIHITDTHIGGRDYELFGVATAPRTERLLATIRSLPFEPDFVIHTGDVATDTPQRQHYEVAARLFRDLGCPVHFLPGNHDDAQLMRELLPAAESVSIDPNPALWSFRFETNGHLFVALDARDGDADQGVPDEDIRGRVSDEQLEVLRASFDTADSVTLFVHFPPLDLDSPWHRPAMILRRGRELHAELEILGPRLRAVFFGHVHRSMQVVRSGVLYSAGASPCVQFPAAPVEEEPTYQPEPTVSFSLVSYVDDQVVIKQYRA